MKLFNVNYPFVILDWEAFKRLLKNMNRREILMWFLNENVINADDFRRLNHHQDDDIFYEDLFIEIEESLK